MYFVESKVCGNNAYLRSAPAIDVFSNVILDALTKSTGYFMMDVDPDMDKGMGEVVFKRVDCCDFRIGPTPGFFMNRIK